MLTKAWRPAATGLLVLVASAAIAQQASAQSLSGSISCVRGEVPANDWAELSQNFLESRRDTAATILLSTDDYIVDDEQPVLRVLDAEGNSVCTNTAEPKSRCSWRINTTYTIFNVIIDNAARSMPTKYRLCAD